MKYFLCIRIQIWNVFVLLHGQIATPSPFLTYVFSRPFFLIFLQPPAQLRYVNAFHNEWWKSFSYFVPDWVKLHDLKLQLACTCAVFPGLTNPGCLYSLISTSPLFICIGRGQSINYFWPDEMVFCEQFLE